MGLRLKFLIFYQIFFVFTQLLQFATFLVKIFLCLVFIKQFIGLKIKESSLVFLRFELLFQPA